MTRNEPEFESIWIWRWQRRAHAALGYRVIAYGVLRCNVVRLVKNGPREN